MNSYVSPNDIQKKDQLEEEFGAPVCLSITKFSIFIHLFPCGVIYMGNVTKGEAWCWKQ